MRKGPFFAFSLLAVSLLLVCRTAGAVQAGQPAPRFALDDTRGRPVSIAALKGQVVILNFFAVWCPPCDKEISILNRLYGKYKSRGVEVLGVTNDTLKEVKDYEARRPVDYPVLIDTKSTAHILYDVLPIPVTFLIGRDGVIAGKFIGPPDAKALEGDVERLLK
ncbi:MAG: TlpA disulfide reductase family protein [Nitrospiraceae bacterium]|nr:TlpA disulfide reductase family protein [Nitrospiraceae bacterium]